MVRSSQQTAQSQQCVIEWAGGEFLRFYAIYLFFRAKPDIVGKREGDGPSPNGAPPMAARPRCHPRTTTGACLEKRRLPSCQTTRMPSGPRGWAAQSARQSGRGVILRHWRANPPRSLNKCGVLFGSDPDYLAAVAAVSPGGTIRNMKVETFSPGLNGPGIWLLTGFKLWRKAAIAMASSAVSVA